MPVVSIAIQKGGSGKTTTAVNLAAALHRKGKSVLLIDSDPQANLTYSLGVSDDCEKNLYTEYKTEIMGQESHLREAIVTSKCGLNIIPSSIDLARAEIELVSKLAREFTLRKRMLKPLLAEFEYIFIDTPPSFGMLTTNALVASDLILIPLQGEFLPKKGVESFLGHVDTLRETFNLQIDIAGFVLTKYSPRKNINQEIRKWVEEKYPDKLFKTFIHTDIKLVTAQKQGEDIFTHAPQSVAANDYAELAAEFLSNYNA
ncbi:MAG: ParA family protein [Gemmatimonadaceae bacterium]|nr:ParA family protein [Chitinophagaceae bacterium]